MLGLRWRRGKSVLADLDADAVTALEHVAGHLHVEVVLVDLAGFEEVFGAVAVAGSYGAVGEVEGPSVGVDVDELDDPVGVAGVGGGEQGRRDRTGDLDVLRQDGRSCR